MASTLRVDTIQERTAAGGVNFSHPVELASGTAAAPSLAFSADANTGLYRISEDKIGIATNGTRVGEIGAGYGGFTGNIIQVQNTTLTSTVSISHSTSDQAFKDITGLTVNITPKYTSSKILILCQVTHSHSNGYIGESIRLMRDSTAIIIGDASGSRSRATGGAYFYLSMSQQYATTFLTGIDSPNTTSQITYKPQINNQLTSSAGTIYINRSSVDNDDGYNSRHTSSIIVMEIQQ